MKITIFGATSQTGQIVVEEDLKQGHKVVTFARTPEKLKIQNDSLSIVKGELTDKKAIDRVYLKLMR